MTQATHDFTDDGNISYFDAQLSQELNGADPPSHSAPVVESPAQLIPPSGGGWGRALATPINSRELMRFERQVTLDHVEEEHAARLAVHAQVNALKIAVAEESYVELAPKAAPELKAIRTAHTIRAINSITGFGFR